MLHRTPGTSARLCNHLAPPAPALVGDIDGVLRRAAALLPDGHVLRVQVSSLAAHGDLDRRLGDIGMRVVDPTDVMVAEAAAVVPTCMSNETAITRVDGPTGRRLHAELMQRDPPPPATTPRDDEVVRCWLAAADDAGCYSGVCLVVLHPGCGWSGVFNMQVHPDARRQGVGAALLGAAARTALAYGADLYLQVSRDNVAAQALYRRNGFRPLFDYHYRQ